MNAPLPLFTRAEVKSAPAYNVVRGQMVREDEPRFLLNPPTCRHCGGEGGSHFFVDGDLCPSWRFTRTTTRFERQVAKYVGRRPENVERLMAELKAALGGES